MEVRQRLYDMDDLWQLVSDPANSDRRFELIEGELFEMVPPGLLHGRLATRLARFLDEFAEESELGIVTPLKPAIARLIAVRPSSVLALPVITLMRVAQPTSETLGAVNA